MNTIGRSRDAVFNCDSSNRIHGGYRLPASSKNPVHYVFKLWRIDEVIGLMTCDRSESSRCTSDRLDGSNEVEHWGCKSMFVECMYWNSLQPVNHHFCTRVREFLHGFKQSRPICSVLWESGDHREAIFNNRENRLYLSRRLSLTLRSCVANRRIHSDPKRHNRSKKLCPTSCLFSPEYVHSSSLDGLELSSLPAAV